MKKYILGVIPILLAGMPFAATAGGLVTSDSALRSDLAWLSSNGVVDLDLSTWPLSQSEIERKLAHAHPDSAAQRLVIERVLTRMDSIKSDVRYEGHTSTGKRTLPQGFDSTRSSQNSATLALSQSDNWWDVHLEGSVENKQYIGDRSDYNLDNSYAAIKFANQWISFGKVPQWWGPGYEGSLIRSDASRPLTGFLMQRADQTAPETAWLNWVGPWQYQLMASQEDQYTSVPHTKVVGVRFTATPENGPLTLGFAHVMQWGGKGRPSDFSDFWNGMTGKDYYGSNNPLGNHLVALDFSYKLGPDYGVPVKVYGQMAGEEVKDFMPSRNMYLLGVEGHHLVGVNTLNWYVEYHDTRSDGDERNLSYRHQVYKDGYYQQGYPLGDAIGGDGQLLAAKVELATLDNQRFSSRIVYARVNPGDQLENMAFPRSDTLKGIQLGWESDVYKAIHLSGVLWFTDANKNDTGASLNIELPFSL
ncbi:capsule assembly Wzi family protein [Scandinavium goeteborgense]|uniref:Capsule assembly protein Wzi n=1 Tax=Scandinavium goeteborgense TaxID=1851514 RepID=A0A4R6E1G3_SCAGO|nr:capsule assembly Wzi family protein [Scandinavium goeteborgense]TDN51523.1 capsule assembly protein Wzi [Scandinavium goeteborgense]